jgi:competence/damage-inducible protein CinA-like protein
LVSAEIITIGTELLLGETVDTNTRYIARSLRDVGVDLYRASTIGDNEERIAQIIQEGITRAEIIITTGGLGPTIDDPTRHAVARAFNQKLEFREELWQQILSRFERFGRRPTENNKRQAFVPHGAISVENPVGTAPSFIYETERNAIIALPGVPREMEYLMAHEMIPYLSKRYKLTEIIKTRVLHTSGVGESQIDTHIDDLEMLSNPTVGLAAHAGQVDIRITAKAKTEADANKQLDDLESEIRNRIDRWIYGVDEETLESVALKVVNSYGWKLVVVESGLGGRLLRRIANADGNLTAGEMSAIADDPDILLARINDLKSVHSADLAVGVNFLPGNEKHKIVIALDTPTEEKIITRTYGGPPQLAPLWAVNICLDIIRRLNRNI